MIELAGAKLDWGRDRSTKRNPFHLRLQGGDELLLQVDNVMDSNEWFHAIREILSVLVSGGQGFVVYKVCIWLWYTADMCRRRMLFVWKADTGLPGAKPKCRGKVII